MFKEQLHESFDRISPSPELLDRISAMMSEEAARPRPAIKMTAVKYGGIAAALAIAAGGTFIVMQNSNSGIAKTGEAITADSAKYMSDGASNEALAYAAAETAAAAASEEELQTENISLFTSDDDYYKLGSDLYGVGEIAAAENAEETEETAETRDLPTVTKTSEVTQSALSNIAATTTSAAEADMNAEPASYDDGDDFILDVSDVQNLIEIDDDDEDVNPSMGSPEVDDSAVRTSTATASGAKMLEWANPASGEGTAWDMEPTVQKFYDVPLELIVKVEGAVELDESGEGYVAGKRWHEYIAEYFVDFGEITGVDKGLNLYTFIEYFRLSDDDVRDALAGKTTLTGSYTDEDVDILFSRDKEKIAAAFVSKWAIVKGEKLYSPYWLDTHSYAEWRAAGITKNDIRQKYDDLIDLPIYLTEEKTRAAYKARIDGFLSDAADCEGVLYRDYTGEKAPLD